MGRHFNRLMNFFFFFFCQQFKMRCPIAVRGYACTSTHNRYIRCKLEGRMPPRKRPVRREDVRRQRRRSPRQGESERSGAAPNPHGTQAQSQSHLTSPVTSNQCQNPLPSERHTEQRIAATSNTADPCGPVNDKAAVSPPIIPTPTFHAQMYPDAQQQRSPPS